jgi:hypothetical protein
MPTRQCYADLETVGSVSDNRHNGVTYQQRAFYGQVVELLAVFRSVLRLDSNSIVDCASQALSAAEIDFRRLNGDVPKEKLDLFEFTTGQMAKACTRATKIVWRQLLDSCRLGAVLYYMPDDPL